MSESRLKTRSAADALNGSKSSSTVDAAPAAADPAAQRELLHCAVQGAHQTIDRVADTVTPHVRRLQQGLSSAGHTLSQRADRMRSTGQEWTESLRNTVRDNPLAALATALAVGMLITRVTRR